MAMPPIVTLLPVAAKLLPVMVIVFPDINSVGLMPDIAGAVTLYGILLDTCAHALVTIIFPAQRLAGVVMVMEVGDCESIVAMLPPIVTELPLALKFVPVIVTDSPPALLSVDGLMLVIDGAGNVYAALLELCPHIDTTTLPEQGMPAGTVPTIWVCPWLVKLVMATPPIVTVLPVEPKLLPVMVIVFPDIKTDGLIFDIEGAVTL
jgi:hypothetical protein